MKIVFNLINVGLGNNGGSRTIIKCAEQLALLGCEVILFSNIKNCYTWGKIANDVKFVRGKSLPKCDVIIATGYGSVKSTIFSKCKRKFYYIRGYELWKASSSDLIKSYRNLKCIVNSEWLYNKLKKNGIKSKIIYQGLDFEDFYCENKNRLVDLGGLYSNRHKTKRHKDIEEIANLSGYSLRMLNRDIKNPGVKELREWYNGIKIWIAPTELEGLHNPPMEASLCGCGLVCSDHFMSGMSDYAIHENTALVYPSRNLDLAINYVNRVIEDVDLRSKLICNMNKILFEKIGSRKNNMKKMIKEFKGVKD